MDKANHLQEGENISADTLDAASSNAESNDATSEICSYELKRKEVAVRDLEKLTLNGEDTGKRLKTSVENAMESRNMISPVQRTIDIASPPDVLKSPQPIMNNDFSDIRNQNVILARQTINSPNHPDGLNIHSLNTMNDNPSNRWLLPRRRAITPSFPLDGLGIFFQDRLDPHQRRVDAYQHDYLELKPADMRFQSHFDNTCGIKRESPFAQSQAQAIVECKICYDSMLENDAFVLDCKHSFCKSCLSQYIQARIDVGNVVDIICPMSPTECGKPILQKELQAILGQQKFSKLDRFALESATNMDPNLRNCPTPDCPYICYWEEQPKDSTSISTCKFFCPLCDSTACLKCCISPYHEGISCSIFKSMPTSSQQEQLTSSYLKQLKNNVRPCGRCGAMIVKKEGGCAKMKCRCGYRFCFICGVENAVCDHTPSHHGFIDNSDERPDFTDLRSSKSPT